LGESCVLLWRWDVGRWGDRSFRIIPGRWIERHAANRRRAYFPRIYNRLMEFDRRTTKVETSGFDL